MSELASALEAEAIEQLKEIRAYRTGPRTKDNHRDAKLALGVIGSSVRLRATLANERTNELVAERLRQELPPATAMKALPGE